MIFGRMRRVLFPDSSVVEQPAVNRRVVGSNPTRGANSHYFTSLFFNVAKTKPQYRQSGL